MSVRDEAQGARSWLSWIAQGAVLLFVAYVLTYNVWRVATDLGLVEIGSRGASFDYSEPGGARVTAVQPGMALDQAGVVVGDKLRFNPPYLNLRQPGVGEIVQTEVLHAGQWRPLTLHVPEGKHYGWSRTWSRVLLVLGDVNTLLIAGFMAWRSRGRATILWLCAGLAAYARTGVGPPPGFPIPLFPFFQVFDELGFAIIAVLFVAFAFSFYRDNVGKPDRLSLGLFWAYTAVQLGFGLRVVYLSLAYGMDPLKVTEVGSYVGFVLCLGYLALGWRRSSADVRQRYTVMLIAMAAIVLGQTLDDGFSGHTISPFWSNTHYVINTILTGVIASGLFAYSIFRHKAFDLGFAVNRSLVYGVVSAILLVCFGLVEWASDHLIPIEGREKNAVVDAAIALAVFLTFHRLRDAVEEVIEKLFFRSWHEREAALRRFVADAAYVLKAKALNHAFVEALNRFAEGAPAAVYLRTVDGLYACAEALGSNAPGALDVDHPAVVALRARRTAISGEDLRSLESFGVALPMMTRAEVTGFVLVGHKPSGLEFRPDEVELLAWATHQIGLDLYALRMEQLEALVAVQDNDPALTRSLRAVPV